MAARTVVSAFIRLHPLLHLPCAMEVLNSHGVVVEHGETVWIDLSLAEPELWRQTRTTYRNNINKLKKLGLQTRINSDPDGLDQFVEIYYRTMDTVAASDWYYFGRDYFRALFRALDSRIHLCVVEDGTAIVSAGLFTECCGIVQYHLSGTDPQSPHQDLTKLMLDFVKSWAKARGNQKFHLGGGVGSQADSLFFFKSGFSKLRALFSSWRIIFHSELYQRATARWQELAQQPAQEARGFFPAYRQPLPEFHR